MNSALQRRKDVVLALSAYRRGELESKRAYTGLEEYRPKLGGWGATKNTLGDVTFLNKALGSVDDRFGARNSREASRATRRGVIAGAAFIPSARAGVGLLRLGARAIPKVPNAVMKAPSTIRSIAGGARERVGRFFGKRPPPLPTQSATQAGTALSTQAQATVPSIGQKSMNVGLAVGKPVGAVAGYIGADAATNRPYSTRENLPTGYGTIRGIAERGQHRRQEERHLGRQI